MPYIRTAEYLQICAGIIEGHVADMPLRFVFISDPLPLTSIKQQRMCGIIEGHVADMPLRFVFISDPLPLTSIKQQRQHIVIRFRIPFDIKA
jgi:hypothetical protein